MKLWHSTHHQPLTLTQPKLTPSNTTTHLTFILFFFSDGENPCPFSFFLFYYFLVLFHGASYRVWFWIKAQATTWVRRPGISRAGSPSFTFTFLLLKKALDGFLSSTSSPLQPHALYSSGHIERASLFSWPPNGEMHVTYASSKKKKKKEATSPGPPCFAHAQLLFCERQKK